MFFLQCTISLCFTDAFPGPSTLVSALRDALHSKDVSIESELNPVLYETIQHYWKDSTRDVLIEHLAQAARYATHDGSLQMKTAVHSQLSALPATWNQEKSELARRVLEKLRF